MHCLDVQMSFGKQFLSVNMDEIYVSFFSGMAHGHQAAANKSMPAGAIPLAQDCSHPHLRMGLAHIALICNVPAMQRLLPQVLIVPPATRFLKTSMAYVPSAPSH